VKTTRIRDTAVHVTEMGLGTAQLGDLYVQLDQRDADEIVDAAWGHGIRHFDTAPHYGLGLSEHRLGRALRGRDDAIVSTKVGRLIVGGGAHARREWDLSGEGVARSLVASLRRLERVHVDIAFVHDPDDDDRVDEAIRTAVPALQRLRDTGDLGAIGVGTKDLPTLLRFVRECDIDVVMVAGRLTLLDHSALADLVPECAARGIAIISAGIFNSGLLAMDRPDPASHFEYAAPPAAVLERARELAAIADRHGYTLPEAAVTYAREPAPPVASIVVGADSAAQVARNAALLRADGDVAGLRAEVEATAAIRSETNQR
jgi:D-threo-aldose 1-dehydrogenase